MVCLNVSFLHGGILYCEVTGMVSVRDSIRFCGVLNELGCGLYRSGLRFRAYRV